MLQAILLELRQSPNPLGLRELSEKFAVQPSAMEGMLMQLTRMGKLEVVDERAKAHCGGCPGCPNPSDCSPIFHSPPRYKIKS